MKISGETFSFFFFTYQAIIYVIECGESGDK